MPAGTRQPFLTARWKHLAMLNYAVDPALLHSAVPAGTELDSFDGITYVSIVGFLFLDTRVLGIGIPMHRDFEELNLRCYVRRTTPEGELRRGVVFIKEIVPRRAIATVARVVYNENYVALPMRHIIEERSEVGISSLAYEWKQGGRWQRVAATTSGPPAPLQSGSIEEFITEHYWGYARQRDGSTVEYQVEHPRWNVQQVGNAVFDCDVASLYGDTFVEALGAAPKSAFVADGSEVTVFRGKRL